jgi:cell surface protein SprA
MFYIKNQAVVKKIFAGERSCSGGSPLIRILRADRLNNRTDPQPDGLYDFVDGFTVISQQGKIIFPVLQPFGQDLIDLAFQGVNPDTVKKVCL